jgi:hypothetical protein
MVQSVASSEPKHEAKDWLIYHPEDTIGNLDRKQACKLVGALLKSGATSVKLAQPHTDTLWITIPTEMVARVMSRLANYHPDETEHLSSPHSGYHLIRAWWD